MRASFLLVVVAAVCAVAPIATAQTDAQRIVLLDGTVVVGSIANPDADPIVVTTTAGIEQRIPRSQIREITPLISGRFTRTDPADTRLFLSPTGRTLGQGAGRFSGYYLLPSVAYGAADFLDVTLGATIPAIGDGDFLMVVAPGAKARIIHAGDQASVAIGATLGLPITSFDGGSGIVGTLYGVGTFGGPTRSITTGIFGAFGNFGFSESGSRSVEFADAVGILLAGDLQVSSNAKLISENHVLVGGGDTVVTMLNGVRLFGDRLTGDIAAISLIADGTFTLVPVPYLGISYSFGP